MFLEASNSFCSKSFNMCIYVKDKYHICPQKGYCLLPCDYAASSQVSLSHRQCLVTLEGLLKGMGHVFASCRGSY